MQLSGYKLIVYDVLLLLFAVRCSTVWRLTGYVVSLFLRLSGVLLPRCPAPNLRKHLSDLRSRLHPSATGDIQPAARAPSSTTTPKRPPSRSQAHIDPVGIAGEGEREGSHECSRTANGSRPGRRQEILGKKQVPSAEGEKADDNAADNSQQLDCALSEGGETPRAVKKGPDDAVATENIDPVPLTGVVEGRPAEGEDGKDTTSTTSRPSELFDSLDLSVS